MCGIAGYFGQVTPVLLNEMLQSIRHSGPDNEGIFLDDNVGLGIRKLAIADQKRGQHPVFNEDKTLCMVFNGKIYNILEIRDELEESGHRFLSKTDTEVVIHAFEEWGKDCLQRFNGMFAFAIWNRINRSLFIARDRLGIKPLYYHYNNTRLVFASEIKALLNDKDIVQVQNDPAIYSFLFTGFQYTNETFFKHIKELQPGYFMVINAEGLKLFKYWDLPNESVQEKNITSKFLALLLDAIRIRIPPELSITHYLSGGLDSSSIVCLTNNILQNNTRRKEEITILTASYNSLWDEASYAEEVSKFIETPITYVYPSSVITWNDLKSFVFHIDEPVTALNYYAYWCLARVTKSKSKVIFMGQGPDEFLAGHRDHYISYLKELLTKKKLVRLFTELSLGSTSKKIFSVLHRLAGTFVLRSERIEDLLDRKFVKAYSRTNTGSRPYSLRESLIQDVKQKRLPMHLRVGDRIASTFSIEYRCPYLDHRIIELSFLLPSNYKIRRGATKYILREAVKGAIPESVRRRKKLGTPVPVESWLKKFRVEITQMMKSKTFRDRGYFNANAISKIYDRYCNNEMNRFEKEYYEAVLWRVINIELWFEVFFD